MIFFKIIDTIVLQTDVCPGERSLVMQHTEYLKIHIIEQVKKTQDEDLLDLILKLLISESGELQATA